MSDALRRIIQVRPDLSARLAQARDEAAFRAIADEAGIDLPAPSASVHELTEDQLESVAGGACSGGTICVLTHHTNGLATKSACCPGVKSDPRIPLGDGAPIGLPKTGPGPFSF